jgi:hypothetical protein
MCTVHLNVHVKLCDIQHVETFAVLYAYGVEDIYLNFVFFFSPGYYISGPMP